MPALTQRVVQKLPALAGDAGCALQRAAEAVQFAREVVQRRLHLTAQVASAIREE